jgi:hypothetical protein
MFIEYMRSKIFKIFNYQFIYLIPEIGSASAFPGDHTGADGISFGIAYSPCLSTANYSLSGVPGNPTLIIFRIRFM